MNSLYQDLIVWKKSIQLAHQVYDLTKYFPKEEQYGLTSQIRRSAISIPSNIAEGACRKTIPDFIHFLFTSLGSSGELETQLIISKGLGYINDLNALQNIQGLLDEIRRMLNKLIKSLKEKRLKPH